MKTIIDGTRFVPVTTNTPGHCVPGTYEHVAVEIESSSTWIGPPTVTVTIDGKTATVNVHELAAAALAAERAAASAKPMGIVGPLGTEFHGL
jgi:hypothetical protein